MGYTKRIKIASLARDSIRFSVEVVTFDEREGSPIMDEFFLLEFFSPGDMAEEPPLSDSLYINFQDVRGVSYKKEGGEVTIFGDFGPVWIIDTAYAEELNNLIQKAIICYNAGEDSDNKEELSKYDQLRSTSTADTPITKEEKPS